MRQRFFHACLIGLALALPAQALDVRTSHAANLRYQLDCLAGLIRCTAGRMPLAALVSHAELERWRLSRHQRSIEFAAGTTHALALPTAADFVSKAAAARPATSAVAADAEPADVVLLGELAERSERRWRKRLAPHLARMALGMELVAGRIDLTALLTQYAGLFGIREPRPPPAMLIAIDDHDAGSLAALAADVAYVETPLGDTPENRLPVLVHEYVHRWQSQLSAERRREIVDTFVHSDNPCAVTTHHFFDEAIATAIGNGLFEQALLSESAFNRYAALPGSFYADGRVDRIAKAVLPELRTLLEKSGEIGEDFVRDYIALASAALGGDCQALPTSLHQVAFLLTDPALAPAQALVQRRLAPATAFVDVIGEVPRERAAALRFRALPAIAVTTSSTLLLLRGLIDEQSLAALRETLARHPRGVIGIPRSGSSMIYVVAGRDEEQASAALLQLVTLRSEAFEGLWVPPPLPGSIPD